MLRNFANDSTTPSRCGSAPPDRLVPAPRATTGTRAAWQMRRIAATCASVSGSTTAAGCSRNSVSPSHSYGFVSSGVVSSDDAGSRAASSARTCESSMGWAAS